MCLWNFNEKWAQQKTNCRCKKQRCFYKQDKCNMKLFKKTVKESRTTKLWILYIEYIYIVKECFVAERICV